MVIIVLIMNKKTFLRRFPLLLVALFAVYSLSAQQYLERRYLNGMYQDLLILAGDSLEGREAGSMGELYAALYIAERFEVLDIKPFFDGCYYQDFDFSDGYAFPEESNSLSFSHLPGREPDDKVSLTPEHFFPYPWGSFGVASGIVADAGYCLPGYLPTLTEPKKSQRKTPAKQVDTSLYADKILLVRYEAPPGYSGNRTGMSELIFDKASYASSLGAAGVIFWDPQGTLKHAPGIYFTGKNLQIPLVFLPDPSLAQILPGATAGMKVQGEKRRSIGKNVAGWIDNGAEKTIVIGAHFDHLGWGIGNSRYDGPPAIHYGADDNASGVAGMLALAEWLKYSGLKGKNYLFVAFSAEEKGLIGSRVFAETDPINQERILAMINYDMIGRVDTLNPEISLLGSGSSPRWGELLSQVTEDVVGKPVQGGLSGSDHYHFYRKEIPVLFFFNGLHDDYHKPSDVIEKINFNGLRDVVEYTIELFHILDTVSTLPYAEVADQDRGSRPKRKFSLGIVPGHGMDVEGVYVQEVNADGAAKAAGILRGDTIVQLGSIPVQNMQHYMQALGEIKAGEPMEVIVLRDGKRVKLSLQF
jgi:hypothetical protein